MKRIVRGICFDDSSLPLRQRKVLLIYERGSWRLPGGHCEGGDSGGEDEVSALTREFLEETGLEIEVSNFLFSTEDDNAVLFFEVRLAGERLVRQFSSRGPSLVWFPIAKIENKEGLQKYWLRLIQRAIFYLEQ